MHVWAFHALVCWDQNMLEKPLAVERWKELLVCSEAGSKLSSDSSTQAFLAMPMLAQCFFQSSVNAFL